MDSTGYTSLDEAAATANSANATRVQMTSEDMEDEEPLMEDEEEEQLIILHPEHPLVQRLQATLNRQLRRQLDRINLQLEEHVAQEKEDAKHSLETGVEMSRIQAKLARLHNSLENYHQTKSQAEDKHQQAQSQMEEMKSQYSSTFNRHSKAKAGLSQLQAEYDNLMLHTVFTQGVSDDLRIHFNATKNAQGRAGAEKTQAEDEKKQQDLYVERLTKEMETQTQQIAMYDAQTSVKAEECQAVKRAYSEAEMEIESLLMMRKHLLQQWNKSLLGMEKRDEAFSAMQEAMRTMDDQMNFLDSEIKAYMKSSDEEHERNEALTYRLYFSKRNVALTRKLIIEKQKQQEDLQIQHSTCLSTLKETEDTLDILMKETSERLAEINAQMRQVEKESAIRLELEDKILNYVQQEIIHNRAAKYSKKLTRKTSTLKEEKISQLWQKEDEMTAVAMESYKIHNNLESLGFVQKALDQEMEKYNQCVNDIQFNISSLISAIKQKQNTITNFNKKIGHIVTSTGRDDLSPLQINLERALTQIEQMEANIKRDKQLWMKRQGSLIELTQEMEVNSKNILKLQKQFTAMEQKKIRWENQIENERQEQAELQKNTEILRGDLVKLNTLLTKNGQLSQVLEQDNVLMETDFLLIIREAEREVIQMQMKHEKSLTEKDRLLSNLVEAEQQIMLWDKKTQLVKETLSVVDSEELHVEIKMMKAEIHRMEVRINQLRKQQENLLRESESTVVRRESIIERREAMVYGVSKQTTKFELSINIKHMQRKIKDTHKHIKEHERETRELQESMDSLNKKLAWQKQQLTQLCSTNSTMDSDIVNQQDSKDRDLAYLVTLQNRIKKLQAVVTDSYKTLSTSESVEATLQSQIEHVHKFSTVLHRVCEKFPTHRQPLRRLLLTLEACTQKLKQ
ncbi:coiled-coil domain-containing protein 40-like [Solea solea]|uniref:coiled-coil domain-containing protein 40-like n=1 Tax=Solea solea TaxID=90069 RepID=UPI00272C255B|nr:coiled-coil domain-containing protein 40-like [Solea solea]